jgi:hypothetical protein
MVRFSCNRQFGDAAQRVVVEGARFGLCGVQFDDDVVAFGTALNLECLAADLDVEQFQGFLSTT